MGICLPIKFKCDDCGFSVEMEVDLNHLNVDSYNESDSFGRTWSRTDVRLDVNPPNGWIVRNKYGRRDEIYYLCSSCSDYIFYEVCPKSKKSKEDCAKFRDLLNIRKVEKPEICFKSLKDYNSKSARIRINSENFNKLQKLYGQHLKIIELNFQDSEWNAYKESSRWWV